MEERNTDELRERGEWVESEEGQGKITLEERQEAFYALIEQLQKLDSCQSALRNAAFHTERLLLKPTPLAPAPIVREQARALTPPAGKSSLSNRLISEMVKEWIAKLALPEGVPVPPVQSQCGSVHWQWVLQEATEIDKAIQRLTGADDEAGVRAMEEGDMRGTRLLNGSSWQIRVLQRDLEWLLPLVRSVARICQMLGDFGDAREPISAASAAYIGERFAQCARDLEQDAKFFALYLEQHPRSFLSIDEAMTLRDVGKLRYFASILDQEKNFNGRLYTPPLIAELMKVSPDTVERCIRRMERSKKLDPQQPEAGNKRARRLYTLEQVQAIKHYYRNKPGIWKKRKGGK